QMSKGKGNKIISISSADAAAGVDKLQWLLILPPGSSITLYVGKRKLIMRDEDLQKVRADRGRRGSVSRGLQRIDSVEVNAPARPKSDASSEE
ncbi:DNA topoisomerase IV subunit A, partial [Serratia sp. Se-PFBMAAmG]|nr:DNA topoisomerase IV subunit A [Serratia sp. Se-PFBMAAmG]